MKITEFADMIDEQIRLTYYPNQNMRWSASFERGEIKESPRATTLLSTFGDGKTPYEALKNLVPKIEGKTIVFNAMGDNRKVFKVPRGLKP